ncbi:MAG: ClpP family protease [Lachnospira sp.]
MSWIDDDFSTLFGFAGTDKAVNNSTNGNSTSNDSATLNSKDKPEIDTSEEDRKQTDNTDGQVTLDCSCGKEKEQLELITIIGEIEGHDNLPATSKTTKYEHLLPRLAQIEENDDIKGVLFLINTVGGDVSAGLALAEMISSMKTPTVSLIIGDSHSIGVPLAVSTDYSYIVPSATMIIHPVRMNGTLLGVQQTYDYFERISDRIITFIAGHSNVTKKQIEKMMVNTTMLSKDLGTVLVGKDAVEVGLVDEVGGISDAFGKLKELMNSGKNGVNNGM